MTNASPETTAPLTIGEVARISGTPATTLRYYEKRGLLESPVRVGGKRRYTPDVLSRLMVIRFCRVAGLSLDDIGVVLADRSPGRRVTDELARRQLEIIADQVDALELARRMLESVLVCGCGTLERCECGAMAPVIAELRARLG